VTETKPLPKTWNQLPAHLRALETVDPFKMALKTHLHCTQWLSQIVRHAATRFMLRRLRSCRRYYYYNRNTSVLWRATQWHYNVTHLPSQSHICLAKSREVCSSASFRPSNLDGEDTTAECTAVYRRQQVDTNNRRFVYETVTICQARSSVTSYI